MAVFNGAFPVLPGKIDAARSFATEVLGSRRAGFNDHHRRAGTTRETWSLHETPAGAFLLVWFDGNPEQSFADLATATDDFMVWFREQVKDTTGVDLTAPAEGGPELLLEWSA